MDNPYSLVLPTNDPELLERFERAEITLHLKAGIPFEEVVRQVLLCGGVSYKYDGRIWRVLNPDQASIDLADFWTRTFTISKKEYEALGMLDDKGNFDSVALGKWLAEDGELGGYSEKRKTLTIRAYKAKVITLDSLLSLYREGYKIPPLYSKVKK